MHPDTACEEFAGRNCWSADKHFETELNYSREYERLVEAVLDTHTCDEDPDLVERGGLPETEERGAYHSGQVLAILH